MNIFLDMDGVLADFHSAALEAHNALGLIDDWPAGQYGIAEVLGISNEEFWKKIEAIPNFWNNLEPLGDGLDLYTHLIAEGHDVYITTTPSLLPACSAAKIEWLNKYLAPNFRHYILTEHKYLLAPNGVLIDDYDRNCLEFARAGGDSIIYPQPWNVAHRRTSERFEFVLKYLDIALKENRNAKKN
jgi:5'(3')-deoxyribonucleotidase